MHRPWRMFRCGVLLLLAGAPHQGWCGWGEDVGRASPADANQLALDKLALKEAESKYDATVSATHTMMTSERQRQLLGASNDTLGDLYRRTHLWWLKSVLEPAALIATNPAASCAEARMGYRRLLDMQRQRQLIGLVDDAQDQGPEGLQKSAENRLLEEIGDEIRQATTRRCDEEALDECVETGRLMAVFEQVLNEMRQDQLLGQATDTAWAKDALDQCAVYQLKFSSSGDSASEKRLPGYKRTVEGSVAIRRDPGAPPISALLPEVGGLAGTTQGVAPLEYDLAPGELAQLLDAGDSDEPGDAAASNPFLTSHECLPSASSLARMEIKACGPGHADPHNPTIARIEMLDLRHISYELDANEQVTTHESGQDVLAFDFDPGPVTITMSCLWRGKIGRTDPFDVNLEVFSESYKASHAREPGYPTIAIRRAGMAGPSIQSAAHARRPAGYPELFVKTIAGKGTCMFGVACTDQTEFTLIHKPEPQPFAPRNLGLAARIDQLIASAAQQIQGQ
jgi:hypothetical protein